MKKTQFLQITAAITYTDKIPPPFHDKFHEVRQMISAFNEHYKSLYNPGWLNCLDKSMNSWLNKFCPGFMFVPRKPHPSGNEYHSICDGDQGKPIMWRIKLQEGKDWPKDESGCAWGYPCKYEGYSKTAALMFDMTKPIHNMGKVVTMDSGFCVTASILSLHDHGVYGQALIKKCGRYWPKHVPGDTIDDYFATKEMGESMTIKQIIDGKEFLVHCQKDDRYVTKVMSTHGLLNKVPEHTTYRYVGNVWKSFNYVEPMSCHNHAKHWVDDVNNRRHDPIGLENVWATKYWPTRQFTFICLVAGVNAVNSWARAWKETAQPQLEFWWNLAMNMMMNKIDEEGSCHYSPIRSRHMRIGDHAECDRPPFTGKWLPREKKLAKVSTKYVRLNCSLSGKKNARKYCKLQ